ncbi:MAG TPA: leucyl aminopeptidase family protein [Xanthomonadaceae bacterium]|nr:leucyl aminopeptidase family protein [Xanthomonadaceae bacterium]
MTAAGFIAPADAPALPLHCIATADLPRWRDSQPAHVQRWLQAHTWKATPGSALVLPGADGEIAGALLGIGDPLDPFSYAHAPTALPEAAWQLQDLSNEHRDAALLGWGLGSHRYTRYRQASRAPALLSMTSDPGDGDVFAQIEACLRVRELVNTPSEALGPADLESSVCELAQRHGAQVEAVVGDDLLAQNFPAIHAVGRASHRAPRLLTLRWGDASHPHLALVGKGVCFDTGGLNLKLTDGMRWMKKDMGGAAHALALAGLVMARDLPVRLTLVIAAVDNALGPDAYRPGDVVATRKGLHVEIDNTDAEGRVILGDALAFAGEQSPELLIDFATLTGAARIALGPDLPALYANDDALAQAWLQAGMQQRDPLWRLPLWRPYLRYLTSGIADLANSGPSKMAGSLTAALYLERFVPAGMPWAHLDVYSWNDADRPGKPAGGEAQGLRACWAMLKARYAG